MKFKQGDVVRVELRLPGYFDQSARSPQQAAAQATLGFATADFELIERVAHWPTLARRHAEENPEEPMDTDAYRKLLMGKLRENIKPQAPREMLAQMLEGMASGLAVTETEDGHVVAMGAMLRNLEITVGEVDGVWYMTKLPKRPK